MSKRVGFIYNPRSGKAQIADKVGEVIAVYEPAGYTVVPHRLDFGADQAEALRGLDDGYDHLLVAGGDGTVNYVVNALKGMALDVPVAVLPSGTANDFAMMLGTRAASVGEMCRDILAGEEAAIDIGRVNGEYFVNVFSCGVLTGVSQKTPTVMKNTFGKLSYYLVGLTELAHYHRMDVVIESDGGRYEGQCLMFLVFNGRTAGTLPIAYLSHEDDGLLDILVIKGDTPLQTASTAFGYLGRMRGSSKPYPQGVEHIRCSHATITSQSGSLTDIDGQPGPGFPIVIECESGGLRVIRPRRSWSGNRT